MAKQGLTYYSADTDRFQDIRVKRLKKRYGGTGYAVYDYIKNEIFRTRGSYMLFTTDEAFDCAEYWGIEESEVLDIVNYCAEIGLFDKTLWKIRETLTSEEIQQRYAEICRRSKKVMTIPEAYDLIGATRQDQPTAEPAQYQLFDQPTEATGEPVPQNSAEFRGIPRVSDGKSHKEKEKKKNPPLTPPASAEGELRRMVHDSLARMDAHSAPPADNPPETKRNPTGLVSTLEGLKVPRAEIEQILLLSRYGEIGNPVWQLLNDIRCSRGRITMPGRFIIARLHAS